MGNRDARRLGMQTRARVHELLTGEVKVDDHRLAELVSEEGLPGHDLRAGSGRWEDATRGAACRWARFGVPAWGDEALEQGKGWG